MYIDYVESPIGTLEITASNSGLISLYFKPRSQTVCANTITKAAQTQLAEYFNGTRKVFDLQLDTHGTAFQKAVWQQLLRIPYGEVRSYLDIARGLNNDKAVRAVGAANGRNPVSIIVPCHRVIGNNGKLTGYAGGLERKAWLLQHEGAQCGAQKMMF